MQPARTAVDPRRPGGTAADDADGADVNGRHSFLVTSWPHAKDLSGCGRATIGGSSKWDNTAAASRTRGETMAEPARIVLDSAVLAGKPVIRGTRLSVDFVIGLMADGWISRRCRDSVESSRA